MIGDFTSKGFNSDFICYNSFSEHFENEERFIKLLNKWIWMAINSLRNSRHHYRSEKVYEFYVDETSHYLILPPFLKSLHETRKKHLSKSDLLESSEDYFKRNETVILLQVKNIIEEINNGNKNKGEIELTKDIFKNKQLRLIDENIKTIFEDNQAISLCEKLSTPFIRTLLKTPKQNISEIHQMAMKCYNKYGSPVISFLLTLPMLQFGQIKSEFVIDKEDFDGELPSIRLKFKSSNEEYFISFYKLNQTYKSNRKIATLYNKTAKRVEGFLTYKGYLQNRILKENIKAKLFLENYKNDRIVYCGVENGFCINCGRKLEDLNSLKVGYGRDCAFEIGIPYE